MALSPVMTLAIKIRGRKSFLFLVILDEVSEPLPSQRNIYGDCTKTPKSRVGPKPLDTLLSKEEKRQTLFLDPGADLLLVVG